MDKIIFKWLRSIEILITNFKMSCYETNFNAILSAWGIKNTT